MPDKSDAAIRLSKLMSERGLCSRREADSFIERGLVKVDGKLAALGMKVLPSAKITLAAEARKEQEQLVTVLLHKPQGYVSHPHDAADSAFRLITPKNLAPGFEGPKFSKAHLDGLDVALRLMAADSGLLIFTQDGRIARQLTGDELAVEAEYIVTVSRPIDDVACALIAGAIQNLRHQGAPPVKVEPHRTKQFRLIVRGNAHIDEACEKAGVRVALQHRVRVGNVKLGSLPAGKWRYLQPDERF